MERIGRLHQDGRAIVGEDSMRLLAHHLETRPE
jgi:hypothetical protein